MSLLASTSIEHITLPHDERVAAVPKATPVFTSWRGPSPIPTYGGKTVLELDGEPCFAEIAILRALERDGWAGAWIDSYRGRCWRDARRATPFDLPRDPADLLARIRSANGGRRGGAWDVVAWRGGAIRFVESKRAGRDRIRPSQRAWLDAALGCGVTTGDLLVVEWSVA